MCDPITTCAARERAQRLLVALHYLLRAVTNGGMVSELHLVALLDDAIALLRELGDFEDVIQAALGRELTIDLMGGDS